jgi:ribosomal protein S8
LKLRQAAIIATALVIISGLIMISPLFLNQDRAQLQQKQTVILSFTVLESDNVENWCQNLSTILSSQNLPATIFIEGKLAEQNPKTITCFGSGIDFGSLTYDNVNLTSIDDYSLKLWEIQQGKTAIDNIANVNSQIFQEPNGNTDEDIYSILSRVGIIADFSYKDHFNIYRNDRFEQITAQVVNANNTSVEYLLSQEPADIPLIIQFDNNLTTQQINSFLSSLKAGQFNFVRSSEFLELVQSRGY